MVVSSGYGFDKLTGLVDVPLIQGKVDFSRWPDRVMEDLKPIPMYVEPSINSAVYQMIRSAKELKLNSHKYLTDYVAVYGLELGWYRIQTKDGEFGWFSNYDVGNYIGYEDLLLDAYLYVADPFPQLYTQPSTNSELVDLLPGIAELGFVGVSKTIDVEGTLWMELELVYSECDIDDSSVSKK